MNESHVFKNKDKNMGFILKKKYLISLTLSGKSPAFVSGGKDLPVSAGVRAPAEMPRSGNEVRAVA
ncbi:hypothetical protein GCM10023142_38850 [Anaerocolumna aminovalerica]|uniref:Uncharacterized protein n=2 Tax=Anaerocolumna aminovalerica TaxID=1527 RepID=A0A1I5H473_9FIRM|nr:hypothetical protein [Anaerocolumna aminovalerica]SFO42836.1 hypothetical protein SAMN04489757_12538 [Anaerocolumna aminovalerica]